MTSCLPGPFDAFLSRPLQAQQHHLLVGALARAQNNKSTGKVSERWENYPGGFGHAHNAQSFPNKQRINWWQIEITFHVLHLLASTSWAAQILSFLSKASAEAYSLPSSAHSKAPRASKFTCLCFLYFGWFSIPSRFGISCYCAWPTSTSAYSRPHRLILITPMISSGKLYASSLFFELFIISFCCFFSIARNKIDGRVSCVLRLAPTHPALILFCLFSYLVSFFGRARIIWCNVCLEKVVKVLRKARWLSPASLIRGLLFLLE